MSQPNSPPLDPMLWLTSLVNILNNQVIFIELTIKFDTSKG